jgi:ATP diphosphatase
MHPIDRLLDIMDQLRDPQRGCPWDLKQTFRSIVPHTLEEAYEVADAIEQGDLHELRGELGDLLFQIVFYARLAKERQAFDFHQLVDGICEKMLRRHPHVFGEASFADDRALQVAWEEAKRQERQELSTHSIESQMDGVTRAMPALVRAEKLQRRAARVGFDWPQVAGAIAKTREELSEVEQALAGGQPAHIEDELGDLLFAVVNVVRLLGCDAEQTLRAANAKFERRFRAMERRLAEAGTPDLTALDLAKMDAAWEAVKAKECR